ncbi:hypothetical protein FRB90_006225 [Tulasnella sp. 427]|nr:hypothetical protein FRB90_006225 [Tulasnella sp. 427]
MTFIAGPSLLGASIELPEFVGISLEGITKDLPLVAPKISRLEIETWTANLDRIKLSEYKLLRRLDYTGVHIAAQCWESLADCPLLKEAVLDFMSVDWKQEWQVDRVYFPALHTITFNRCHATLFVPLLIHSEMPLLTSLIWNGDDRPSKLERYNSGFGTEELGADAGGFIGHGGGAKQLGTAPTTQDQLSRMDRVLSLPEIVLLIFRSGLSFENFFHVAPVCRLWNDCASEVRWKEFAVPIRAILQVLAPVESGRFDMYGIQGEISRVQWRRFVEISNRILTLKVNCKLVATMQGKLLIAEKIYGGVPFARLHSLEVLGSSTNWSTTSVFIVPSIKCMKVETELHNENSTVTMLDKYMTPFGSKLELLDVSLRGNSWMPGVPQYRNLQQLTCCVSWIQPTKWRGLGDNLNLIQLSVTEDTASPPVQKWDEVTPWVEFPALKWLKFAAQTGNITSAILHSFMPCLENLLFGTPPEPSQAQQKVIEHLSGQSPLLDLKSIYPANA